MTNQKYMGEGLDFPAGKVFKECEELTAAIGMSLRWGWMSVNPELPLDQQETNADWVRHEIADVRGALDNLEREMERSGLLLQEAANRAAKAMRSNETTTMFKPVSERPEFDHQPYRQFIRLEGSREHSGLLWRRVWFGEAFIRKSRSDDEMLQYRKSDILRLCVDGDIDPLSAHVTHWAPATFAFITTRHEE